MKHDLVQNQAPDYGIAGGDAASIARSVEHGVVTGALTPGQAVPSVRGLARVLGVSPSTVASAYRELRHRGILVSHQRSRTVVGHRPPLAVRLAPSFPAGAVDLASGNPDARLLPDHAPAIAAIPSRSHHYGDDIVVGELIDHARRDFAADGVAADHLAVVSGGLDGIERVLQAHLSPGDRVAVEDPGYAGSLDLIRALGLDPVGVAIDDDGMVPDQLERALRAGASAVLHVPRGQNPTGARTTPRRASALAEVLDSHPRPLLIEDDHAGPILDTPWASLLREGRRFAVIRSVAKWLGPGLRFALVAADADTVARVLGRQRLGTGWVPQVMQHLVAGIWSTAEADGSLHRAAMTYTRRRVAVLDALEERGIHAHGVTGLNVWIPVPEEVPVVQGLADRGWAVQAGEPYRLRSAPAIRVTTASLQDPITFADDLRDVLGVRLPGRRG